MAHEKLRVLVKTALPTRHLDHDDATSHPLRPAPLRQGLERVQSSLVAMLSNGNPRRFGAIPRQHLRRKLSPSRHVAIDAAWIQDEHDAIAPATRGCAHLHP
jgi:hypothetical protein